MAIERFFLGWDRPCLHEAARWLLERYGGERAWDMSGVVVVTPGARAGRRLMEILVERAGSRVLTPPRMVTPGSLPELLYEPHRRVADDLRAILARVHALRGDVSEHVQLLMSTPPERDDIAGWWRLADELRALDDALAGDLLTPRDVPQKLGLERQDRFVEEDRWRVIAELHEEYQATLDAEDWIDRHAARAVAIERGACVAPGDIVLLATVELNQVTRRMLSSLSGAVMVLVHAPAEEGEAFDELGCVVADRWVDRLIELDMSRVHVADRPRDQASRVLRLLESFGPRYSVDQVTVGMGDETLAGTLRRSLGLAGVPARSAVGMNLLEASPVLFLRAMGEFVRSGRFDDFTTLLRHPDVEVYLRRTLGETDGRVALDWLTLFDRYLTDHLQQRPVKAWLGERGELLKRAWEAVVLLAATKGEEKRSLPAWSEAIAGMLGRLYAGRALDRRDAGDAPVYHALDAIAGALREQATLNPQSQTTPRTDLATAIAITLSRIAGGVVPDASSGPAVEMLGWLELLLDDVPSLIVTGVNEGQVPESMHAHAFLPDSSRRALGMLDNRGRYAREVMTLTAILHSKPEVHLITGRRTAQGDPLTPSRLLLACDERLLPERVLRLCGERSAAPSVRLLREGGRSRFIVPPPVPLVSAIQSLSVTGFRAYLACPYRFYLAHVLKLNVLDDRAVELTPQRFGDLAHETLEAFAGSDLAGSGDADLIADFLITALGEITAGKYGHGAPTAVTIQKKILEERLRQFARWQAQQTREGWAIRVTERKMEAQLDVDGEPFTISGRIDRVDVHADGRVRISDYKTSDAGKSPNKTHLSGGEWVDLQLPLYRVLAERRGLVVPGGCAPELGYIQLPKKLSEVGFAVADWNEAAHQEAIDKARWVIRQVRAGVFWPPRYPVDYHEEFAGICQDDSLDRNEALAAGNRQSHGGPGGGGA